MVERLLVIGGDAAGMSAASQAKRLRGEELEVVAVEKSAYTSYSACGIPYWVAGDVTSADALVARSPEKHRQNGIDVRMGTEAVAIDLAARKVEVRHEGASEHLGFDQLLIATGAVPLRPPVSGVDAKGVYGIQTLADGAELLAELGKTAENPSRAIVVGAGYIGIEMAEALVRRGLTVTVIDKASEPMTTLDPDLGRLVHEAMEGMGIDVVTGVPVEAFETTDAGEVRAVVAGGETYEADLVVLGAGVRPNSTLAAEAGLPLGATKAIRVDERQVVRDHDGIWAAGDCVETYDRVSGRYVHVPLGTHANKQGRVAGTNLGGGSATFPGIVRTAVSKVCDLEVGRTGLLEAEAREADIPFLTVTVESTTRAGYFPGAKPITVKLLAERGTGRLLGAQIVGREGSAKRIDICAMALWNAMTVSDLAMVDLSYAPPFSPVWDPVLIAARKASDGV